MIIRYGGGIFHEICLGLQKMMKGIFYYAKVLDMPERAFGITYTGS